MSRYRKWSFKIAFIRHRRFDTGSKNENHGKAQEHIYMRALFVTNALLNLCPSMSGHKTSERSEKLGMRRAVTSKSIRHHQWTSSSENLDGDS